MDLLIRIRIFWTMLRIKKADVVRMYLPPDTNCLLSCFDHCIRSRNYVNVMVTSKHPRPQWLTMDQAVKHCTQGYRYLGLGKQRAGGRT